MEVESTIRPAKGRIAGFEGREGHRTPFASVCILNLTRKRKLVGSGTRSLSPAKSSGVSSGVSWFFVEQFNHALSILGRKMCIAKRHRNSLVAESFLNGAKASTAHNKAAGKRVAQIVPVEVLDFCLANRWLKPVVRTAE